MLQSEMVGKNVWKLRLLLKSIKISRNLYLFPITYFGLSRNSFVFFNTKNGQKLKILTYNESTDIVYKLFFIFYLHSINHKIILNKSRA